MKRRIILSTQNKKELRQLSEFLTKQAYLVRKSDSIRDLEDSLKEYDSMTALLDLDSITFDNYTIRRLASEHPNASFLCISERRLHPDLKDAICNHFYACMAKPVDFDELLYWLRCIEDNTKEAGATDRPWEETTLKP